jgi:GWxTD domain-containing protein
MRAFDLIVRAQVSEALGWTLIHFLWEGAIIAAALAMLFALARSPRIRYMAGCAALMAMLASFVITFLHFLPEQGSAAMPGKIGLPLWGSWPDVTGTDDRSWGFGSVIPLLGPLWIGGVCIFYLRYAVAWLSLSRMRRRSIYKAPDRWQRALARLAGELKVSRPVVLFESLFADTPMIVGHFRPVIMTPLGFLAGLPPDQVEAILLHELAHIRRWDYLMNACQRLVEGLLFYHPAVWWISRVIRAERENCCDDIVVQLRGDVQGYASALAALEQNRLEQDAASHQPVMAATGGNLMKRIKRLLYPKNSGGVWAPALAMLILMASAAATVAAWHMKPDAGLTSRQTSQTEENPWRKWLNEDVVYIISDEEKVAFERLNTDEERQHFVEQFWARRDPTPGTAENEFKEEHYRRLAFANRHFASKQQPGWKTDRGRIYIRYGPPDEIDSHPSGGTYRRPDSEGGGSAITCPFEDWRYNHFEGVGTLTIEFVDVSASGEFRMTLDSKEKYRKP